MSKSCIITTVKSKIKGNATSYIEKENEVFIPVSKKFSLNQTRAIAQDKVTKINKEYLSEKFGNVVSLNTSYTDGTGINIHPSQLLIDAYEVKEGNKTIEEVNPRNLDYFNGDEALLEQEQKEDSDLKPFIKESKNIGEQIKAIDQQVQEEKTIKAEVSELFEENPDFSFQIYEALGVKQANISFNIEPFGKSIDNVDVIKDGKKIGYVQISKNSTSKTLTITGIELKEKGVGKNVYLKLQQQYPDFTIKSDKTALTPDAVNMWDSLVSKKLAIKQGDKQYTLDTKQAQQLYSQYLEQNPNGSVEQFKSWVDNKNNFDKKLTQKIQDKLEKLYPEIKLNITNNPVWEQGKDILNQIIENEMNEEYWRNLYTQKNISNREEFESVKIPTIKNKFKPDFENVYHGTNTYEIDNNGNLILTPSKNFENKTTSISFTQIPVVAQDYMLRKGGNIIIKINNEALGSNYDIESAEEIAVNGNQLFIVPKGQYEIITVPTFAEKMRKKYANEVEIRAEELKNNAKSDLHLIDAIYSEIIAADNYSELQEYGDVDISEQAPEWYVPDEYLDSRSAKKVYEDILSKINKEWVINTLSNTLIEQIKNTGEYIASVETALNDISTYGGRHAPHQSTLFEELLNEIGLGYSQRSTYLEEGEKLEKAKQKQKEYNELLDAIESLVEKEAEKSIKYYNSPENVKLREEQKERDRINREITQNLIGTENIDDLPFQKIGDKIIGQANIKAMTVLVDAVNQKQDTLPHEYAHHYIAWYRNTPIVQEAIKKWGSEEALVQSIGEQVVKQKGEAYNWWNKFVKWIMNQFNSLSKLQKEELTQILTDAFLTRQDLGSKQDIEGFKKFVNKKINNIKADESINERLMKYEESIKIPNNIKSKILEKIEKETEKLKEKLLSLGFKQEDSKFEFFTNSYTTFKMKLKELDNLNVNLTTNKGDDFYQINARLKTIDSTLELKKQGELPFTPIEVKQVIQEQQFLNDVADNVFEGLSEEEKQILKKKIENGDYDLNCRI